jgi:putative DNA primase/helicase
VPLGSRDPATNRLVLSNRKTLPTAKAFVDEFHTHADGHTLASYAGLMMAWQGNRYVEVEDEALRHRLQPWLHEALQYVYNKQTGKFDLVPFDSNPGTVKSAFDSIRTFAHIPASTTPPTWLSGADGRPDAREVLPCRSLNLHIPTGQVLPATPALFTTNALDFDFDPSAAVPAQWLAFLQQLWDGDDEAIQLLQEWFGYCLTADTSQQKMLLLVGPKRSGKGTIGRVLQRLVGAANVAGPTTRSLAGSFGLQPLIGKSLAIVSDARFSGEDVLTVVERLLCISGEDALTIDRKHIGSVTMKLPTRFIFLTNELPRFTDASAALAGRFMILRLAQSFYGREDPTLTQRLLAELPGILLWALQGWQRLRERCRFVQPQSVADAIRDLEDLSSPVGAFVRERCVIGAGMRAYVHELYEGWKSWCDQQGRNLVTTRQTFGRDLVAAVPGIVSRQSTGGYRFYEGIGVKAGAETLP